MFAAVLVKHALEFEWWVSAITSPESGLSRFHNADNGANVKVLSHPCVDCECDADHLLRVSVGAPGCHPSDGKDCKDFDKPGVHTTPAIVSHCHHGTE